MTDNAQPLNFKKLAEDLRKGIRPNGPKSIYDMSLDELKEIESKFLLWYPKTNHPEKEVKKHIYETYIKPRIQEFNLQESARDVFFINNNSFKTAALPTGQTSNSELQT